MEAANPLQENVLPRLSTGDATSTKRSDAGFTKKEVNRGQTKDLPKTRSTSSVRRQESLHIVVSRAIVENKYFVGFTTLLTVYALTGDDIRLIATAAGADPYFDIVVGVCILVFTVEVIFSCIGKEDYFMGFFFILDVISTATLILDLSFVADQVASWMSGGSDEDDEMGSLRAGRTARIGAKAARIVRVLRLVRILKLYKAYYDAQQRKKRLQQGDSKPGENHWDDDDDDDFGDLENADVKGADSKDGAQDSKKKKDPESRVGKKLSEMTTRKVIMLVLTMLLGLPFLKVANASTATSAQYGAEHLWRILNSYVANQTNYDQYAYELLDYVYYHNWYSTKGYCPSGSCANNLYAHLFWVGMTGSESAQVQEMASKAEIKETSVIAWEAAHKNQDDIYNYGQLPPEVITILSSKWKPGCDTKSQVRYGISLLGVEVPGANSRVITCPEELRSIEKLSVRPNVLTEKQMKHMTLVFYYDLRPYIRLDAAYNLLITTFICIVLCVSSLYFASDANRLVLTPVENMIKRVEAIRQNPLIAIKMADEEFRTEMVAKAKLNRRSQIWKNLEDLLRCRRAASAGPMETLILERTVIKLGSLLALGFGEAGANIISHNMKGTESSGVNASTGVNAIIPGQRVECIIGIARIRSFATTTEVLQSKIMTFVNQIAEIVHGVVIEHQGAPNKNNGESFFIVWEIGRNFDSSHEVCDTKGSSRLAGMSIMAFIKIIGAIRRSKVLASYGTHPGLQQRLGANCYVKMGLGLHCGWAIEGAVGSEFKIDASYLSPNVSVAISLERATITYGVPLMVAESVVDCCSPGMRAQCRVVDCVKVTGYKRPMRLFTVDVNPLVLSPVESKSRKMQWNPRNRFKARQFLDQEKQMKMGEDVEISKLFNEDSDIVKMRRAYTSEFMNKFGMGFHNYLEGEWAVARKMLVETETMLEWHDGPSTELLRFMETKGYQAPNEWKGVRDLPKCVV